MLVLCKAKGPTCSFPSQKRETRDKDAGVRKEGGDGALEREKKLASRAGDEEWVQEKVQAKEPWVHLKHYTQ